MKKIELFMFVKGGFADNEDVINEIVTRVLNAGFKIKKGHFVNYTYEDGRTLWWTQRTSILP